MRPVWGVQAPPSNTPSRCAASPAWLSSIRGELTPGLVEALAQAIAKFHGHAEIASPDTPHGSASEVGKYALENFAQIGTEPDEIDARNALAFLRAWTETQLERHRDLIDARKRQGRVRQCHGICI